jgi:hypothetical protein
MGGNDVNMIWWEGMMLKDMLGGTDVNKIWWEGMMLISFDGREWC